jgi:hypothetical protein
VSGPVLGARARRKSTSPSSGGAHSGSLDWFHDIGHSNVLILIK